MCKQTSRRLEQTKQKSIPEDISKLEIKVKRDQMLPLHSRRNENEAAQNQHRLTPEENVTGRWVVHTVCFFDWIFAFYLLIFGTKKKPHIELPVLVAKFRHRRSKTTLCLCFILANRRCQKWLKVQTRHVCGIEIHHPVERPLAHFSFTIDVK